MKVYVVNDDQTRNPGLHHEVHTLTHAYALGIVSYSQLGEHENAVSAVKKAKLIYQDADGCARCSPEAHTG